MSILFLPKELIFEILSRIPAESVLRFKFASKAWHSFIADPSFVKLHLSRSILRNDNHPLLITQDYYSTLEYDNECDYDDEAAPPFKLDFLFERLKTPIKQYVGYCNGLHCYYGNDENIILWNLSTREYQNLPCPSPDKVPIDYLSWGFGFHPKTEEYKVVRTLGVVGGCLSMLDYRRSRYEIWIMKDYGVKESWMKTFTIRSSSLLPKFKILKLFGNGDILLHSHSGKNLFIYSSEYENTRVFVNRSIDGNNLILVENFIGSLVSPKQIEKRSKKKKKKPKGIHEIEV